MVLFNRVGLTNDTEIKGWGATIYKKLFYLEKCSLPRAFKNHKLSTKSCRFTSSAKGIHCSTASSDYENFINAANYRCMDGHYVRSRAEVMIDNWLYTNGIAHERNIECILVLD